MVIDGAFGGQNQDVAQMTFGIVQKQLCTFQLVSYVKMLEKYEAISE